MRKEKKTKNPAGPRQHLDRWTFLGGDDLNVIKTREPVRLLLVRLGFASSLRPLGRLIHSLRRGFENTAAFPRFGLGR